MLGSLKIIVRVEVEVGESDGISIEKQLFRPHKKRSSASNSQFHQRGQLVAQTLQYERGLLFGTVVDLFNRNWSVYKATREFVEDKCILRFYLEYSSQRPLPEIQSYLHDLVYTYAFSIRVFQNPDSSTMITLWNAAEHSYALAANAMQSLPSLVIAQDQFVICRE